MRYEKTRLNKAIRRSARKELHDQGKVEEELDAAQGDGSGRARTFLDLLEVEKVVSEFFLGDAVGGLVKVFGELSNGVRVGFLSALG